MKKTQKLNTSLRVVFDQTIDLTVRFQNVNWIGIFVVIFKS
jgi:hypothetical protein